MNDTGEQMTVGELAASAGITVRTLRHYDAIGLLTPSGRSDGGYRLYGADDARRVRQIVVYRTLGFSLPDIATILADPEMQAFDHLHRQYRLLGRQIEKLTAMRQQVRDEFWAGAPNAGRRNPQLDFITLGHDGSERRLAVMRHEGAIVAGDDLMWDRILDYDIEELDAMGAEGERIVLQLAKLLMAGEPAESVMAMDAAEEHRLMIERWFYACPPAQHALYSNPPEPAYRDRIDAAYDETMQGLGVFIRLAIVANAARMTGETS